METRPHQLVRCLPGCRQTHRAGVGGRWLEIYDDAAGDVLEVGQITVWEPGIRLVFLYHDGGHALDGTEVEVRFEAIEGGTRVTLEHRGWDKVASDVATRSRETKRWGWTNILGWYKEWAFWGSPRRIQGRVRAGNIHMAYR